MNRTHEVCEVVYNRRRRSFASLGSFVDRERAPLGVFGRAGISDVTSFDAWWKGRGIPGARSGLQRILDVAGVDVPEELVMRNLGLSLSDQYWIRPEGSGISWHDINFFNNSIERVSELTAPLAPVETSVGAHPDNTSDGNLSKRWVEREQGLFLLKGGGGLNQEPYNEVVATALHRRMLGEGECVPYTLVREGEETLCACAEFLMDEEEYVPAVYVDRLLPERGDQGLYQHYLSCCDQVGVHGAEEALWKMIVCDDVIANADRHWRNFGIVRNVETLACRPAPIFDSGSCLWTGVSLDALKQGFFSFEGKQFEPNPARQLLLVDDFGWFAPDALDGFVDEAIEILSGNDRLGERLPYIRRALARRVERIVDIREWS